MYAQGPQCWFFWLLLLGVFTFIVVKRSVAGITRTPVWLLWFVMMLPAFTLAAWVAINGSEDPAPTGLLLVLFIACPVLYWVLLQWGRIPAPKPTPSDAGAEAQPATSQAAKPALRPIDKEEEATPCISASPGRCTTCKTLNTVPQAMICRGTLRASANMRAYETVRTNIRNNFGRPLSGGFFRKVCQDSQYFALCPNPKAKRRDSAANQAADPSWYSPGVTAGYPVHHHCRRGLPGRYHRSTTAKKPPACFFPGVALCPGPY